MAIFPIIINGTIINVGVVNQFSELKMHDINELSCFYAEIKKTPKQNA
jgi:hypothetical protein